MKWRQRGFGTGLESDCRRFAVVFHAYGLWSVYDYGGEDWEGRATLPDGRKAASVATFRSLRDAKTFAEKEANQ